MDMIYVCFCFHGRKLNAIECFCDEAILTALQIIGYVGQVFLRSEKWEWLGSSFYSMERLVQLSGLVNFHF